MKQESINSAKLELNFNIIFIKKFEEACHKLGIKDEEIFRKAMVKTIKESQGH